MREWGIGAAAMSVLWVCGCSLAGLASYETAHCDATHHCDELNARDHLDETACVRWNCEVGTRACVLGERDLDGDGDPDPACSQRGHDCDDHEARRLSGGTEQCDGLDNDCDLTIDENVVMPTSADVLGTPGAPELTVAATRTRTLVWMAGGAASVTRLDDATPSAAPVDHEMPPAWWDDDVHMGMIRGPWSASAAGCPAPTMPPGSFMSVPCNEIDAAIETRSDGTALLATVSSDACVGGMLRVGLLTGAVDRHQGPSTVSNAWFGIDVVGSCTGTAGAARPSLSMEGDDHALLAYLRVAAVPPPSCADAIDAEVVLSSLRVGSAVVQSAPVTYVTASAPIVLGRTRTLAPASLVAWSGVGWLVAFPDTGTGLALRIAHTDASGALTTTALPSIDGVGALASVGVAAGPTDGAARVVGLVLVASRTAAGECIQRRPITFVRVRIDPSAGTAALLGTTPLGDGSEAAIAYTPEGFSSGTTARGGWIVMTTTATGVVARRIREDGTFVDHDPIDTGDGTHHPQLFAHDDAQATLAYFRDGTLVSGELLCSP